MIADEASASSAIFLNKFFKKSGGPMLHIARKITELSYEKLMNVYIETLQNAAAERFSGESEYYALQMAEQDWYQYLNECFYKTKEVFVAVWMVEGKYASILRVEPYMDGFIISGLETAPEFRGKGYGTKVLSGALHEIAGNVYSHIRKENAASIRVHEKCGFQKCMDTAWCLDGSFTSQMGTWIYNRDNK